MKVKVECRVVIEVDLGPEEMPEGYSVFVDLEERHCPGTGPVGAALRKVWLRHEAQSTCASCALGGKTVILEIDGQPVKAPSP